LCVLLGACSAGTPDRDAAATRPGEVERLRLAAGAPRYPSPVTGLRVSGAHVDLMFDHLVWKDSTGEVLPWLATAWTNSADGTEWRYTIRDGVKWQDGTPLTNRDVAFTYNYFIKGPAAIAGIFGAVWNENFREVVAEGPNQVVFRMKRPWATFLVGITALVPILPEHIWGAVTDPATFTGPQAVAGSGPYRMESYDQATGTAAYVANDAYFLGRPYVRRIEFVPAADQLLALQRGDIDAADAGTEDQLPDAALAPFREGRFDTITGPSDWNRALHFNLTKGFPFDNVAFRQAVASAVDRGDMVKRILFGQGVAGSAGGLAPSNPWAAPDLPAYPRDVAKARALLDQIGVKDLDGDGTRDLPDGRKFAPELQTSSQYSPKAAELIAEYLRDVGIAVRIRTLDQASADTAALRGEYEMAVLGYGGVGGDPDVLMRIRLSPRAIPLVSKAWGYNNPRVEELGIQQLYTASATGRRAAIQEIQRIVADEVPFLSLYLPTPQQAFVKATFDAWYFTPGGIGGGRSGALNKHVFVTGKKAGF
ncbi:MAG TPA: ABC transporter substrate-binding protein, partial [Acidimicrobiales bacterium]|nr:ABC transporter substrate-binding protein [Acidimicrobiales bacterium]